MEKHSGERYVNYIKKNWKINMEIILQSVRAEGQILS